MGRYHVIRQLCPQVLLQSLFVVVFFVWYDITYQLFVPLFVVFGQYDRLLDLFALFQYTSDLARFYPVPSYLYLVVYPADEQDIPILLVLYFIAGGIDAFF